MASKCVKFLTVLVKSSEFVWNCLSKNILNCDATLALKSKNWQEVHWQNESNNLLKPECWWLCNMKLTLKMVKLVVIYTVAQS